MKSYLITDVTIETLRQKFNSVDRIEEIIEYLTKERVNADIGQINYEIRKRHLERNKSMNPNLELYHKLHNKNL